MTREDMPGMTRGELDRMRAAPRCPSCGRPPGAGERWLVTDTRADPLAPYVVFPCGHRWALWSGR